MPTEKKSIEAKSPAKSLDPASLRSGRSGTKKAKEFKYYEAIGRRKTAVARVRLYLATFATLKKGDIVINGKPSTSYFASSAEQNMLLQPLHLADSTGRFGVSVKVVGGGKKGQLEAVVLGISRALEKIDKGYRVVLKEHGLLTRDSRERERRKVGTGGRARRKKQSPKR